MKSRTACDDQFNADPNMTIDTMLSEIKSLQEQRKNIDNNIEQYRQEITKRLQECGIDWESGDVTFDPNEIVEGSVWECIKTDREEVHRDCSMGTHYKLEGCNDKCVNFKDDKGDRVLMFKTSFLEYFKRVK